MAGPDFSQLFYKYRKSSLETVKIKKSNHGLNMKLSLARFGCFMLLVLRGF